MDQRSQIDDVTERLEIEAKDRPQTVGEFIGELEDANTAKVRTCRLART